MGLGSVMQTALTGLHAASTSIQVAANNLANQQTPGFKASRPEFATLPPATGSSGVAVGRGVGVAEIGINYKLRQCRDRLLGAIARRADRDRVADRGTQHH